jgi:hypothetical protein
MVLSAAQRLAAIATPRVRPVQIEGEIFHVKSLTGTERSALLKAMREAAAEGGSCPDYLIVAMGLCEPDGRSPFASAEEAARLVGTLDGRIINIMATATLKVSGLAPESEGDAEKK